MRVKKLISVVMSVALLVSTMQFSTAKPVEVKAADYGLNNPTIESDSSMTSRRLVTWDCIYFGSYPQTEIVGLASQSGVNEKEWYVDGDYKVDSTLYSTLKNSTNWDSSNNVTIDGTKYKRVKESDATYTSTSTSYYSWSDSTTYHYFRYDPIKWRVLNVNGDDAFLLADKALDDRRYNQSSTSITWETSTVRSWLNGYDSSINNEGINYSSNNFINTAFTSTEKSSIKDTNVVNSNNINYGTPGGNNSTDKIFLLSESEVYNTDTAVSYGFVKNKSTYDETRRCKSSTYAKAMGVYIYTDSSYLGNCDWWLRSPGFYADYAAGVYDYGNVSDYGSNVDYDCGAIRPALHLNLSSISAWKLAGTVNSKGVTSDHNYIFKSNNDATCTQDGTKTEVCVSCGEKGKTVIDEGSILPHTPQIDNLVNATCTLTGLTEGSHCSVCGTTIVKQNTISKLGHSFTNYKSNNDATCTADGTETAKCDRCDVTNTRIEEDSALGHTSKIDKRIEPTCILTGLTEGSHCEVCGVILVKQNSISKLGHSFTNYISNNDADLCTDGTKTAKCDRCDVTNTITDDGTGIHDTYLRNKIEATCTKKGYSGDEVCNICGKTIAKGHVTENGDHVLSNWVSNEDATCEQDGTKTGKCSDCGQTVTVVDKGSALGHTEVIDKAVKATCTEKGLTAGKHCSVCGEIIIEQQEVQALGHDMSEYVSDNNATCIKDGTKTSKCDRCDKTDTVIDEGSALGHTEVNVTAVAATCTKTGLTEGKQCLLCNEILKGRDVVAKWEHRITITNVKAATLFNTGYTGDSVCSVCGTVIAKGSEIAKLTLKKPTLKATVQKKKVKLAIGKITGATKYEVKYKQGKKWITKVITKTSYTIKKLKSKKKVTIQVRAIAISGKNKVYSKVVKKTVKVK